MCIVPSDVMAAGTRPRWHWLRELKLGEQSTAGTVAVVTLVFFQTFNLLNVRHSLVRRQPGEGSKGRTSMTEWGTPRSQARCHSEGADRGGAGRGGRLEHGRPVMSVDGWAR